MLNWVAEDTLQRRHLPYSVAITMQTRKVKGSASHSTPPFEGRIFERERGRFGSLEPAASEGQTHGHQGGGCRLVFPEAKVTIERREQDDRHCD